MPEIHEVIIVGTSFAAAFFAVGLLRRDPTTKITFIEWGGPHSYDRQLANRDDAPTGGDTYIKRVGNREKTWLFHIGHGGTSNYWWGQALRLLPADFSAKPLDQDGPWPISYDDLEPFYCDAEDLIGVATSINQALFPRSRPPRHAPHLGNDVDLRLLELYPDSYMICPSARTLEGTKIRPPCCNNGVCGSCPIDSKFRVLNELKDLFSHPSVTLLLNHEVRAVEMAGGAARGVVARTPKGEVHLKGDLVFLGANAIFNPAILIRSGLGDDRWTGRGIAEQVGLSATVDLETLRSSNGTTHITGLSLHGARENRATLLRYLVEGRNTPPALRFERNRLLNRAEFKIVVESPLSREDRVEVSGDQVIVHSQAPHPLVHAQLEGIKRDFTQWIKPIGIERVDFGSEFAPTEGHIQCSTRMSARAEDGVVDGNMRHHRVPGLMIGGASVFPNCPPSNPSLSIAALSLRAASLV